ncbi:MAG: riboflavin synthase [Bryobacteraceae bacterium]|jgi:riboflavin synthase
MFTGIIEEVGKVLAATPRLRIACAGVLSDTVEGSSIAVNGVCLTAVRLEPGSFGADVSPETMSRTNLGGLAAGTVVNLERPMAVGERLSGHIVQGHVDATGEMLSLEALPDRNWWLRVRVPHDLERYLIHKGSLTIDGISLTIAELKEDIVSVAIIPHTYEMTNLHTRKPADRVNLEVDLIAKYVEKLLSK